ncbi:MAG: FMN-binding negative transcriptional regulator [Alphaproteobacteria bacterium]|nr:FMN-binding negative transcriptional regulator [Alphaproteobacteria bacterium]
MYLPDNFKETDVGVLHDTIRRIKFGTLVTFGPDGLVASHVPMLIDPEPAPFGTLSGHVARANPHWREASSDTPALAIFLGPNTYVSPSAYATKRKTGKVVPTWNYVAVHAYGPLQFYDDADRLLQLVTRLTDTHETGRPNRWHVSDAPADYTRSMLKAIVGFELPIARLEGKWKMSQNRPAEDVPGIVDALSRESDTAADVARIVAERNKDRR